MDLLSTRWVDPVRQYPRTRAYGFFAKGTVPPLALLIWFPFILPIVFRFLEVPGAGLGVAFSPGGKWFAYEASETGRQEVYIVPFPEPKQKIPVSTGGGANPKWSPDGRELYYIADDGSIMSASIKMGQDGSPLFKPKHLLFFDVSRDGKRFLVSKDAEDQPASAITLITNWPALLPKQ